MPPTRCARPRPAAWSAASAATSSSSSAPCSRRDGGLVAEHLRAAIADAGLTAGAGATALRDGEDVETAWSRADRLLLEAKRAGRDRVRVA